MRLRLLLLLIEVKWGGENESWVKGGGEKKRSANPSTLAHKLVLVGPLFLFLIAVGAVAIVVVVVVVVVFFAVDRIRIE